MAVPINITENVVKKVYELVSEEGNFNLKLRVFIQGGGCHGFQYGFAFVEKPEEADLIIEKSIAVGDKQKILQFLVDNISLMYLQNAEIDYVEDVKGSQFVIRNPNANTICGCGSSFGVDN